MASSSYPTRTHTTTRSLTYSYTHIQPTSPSNPYILFLHGFPSSSHDWYHQIIYLSTLGYGIIAPDLLGYGGTSKPLSMHLYKLKDMASDLHEILSLHSISASHKAIGVGHDWGSLILSRLVNYYPELFKKLAFLDVGLWRRQGLRFLGIFLFMDEEGSAELLDTNPESVMSIYYTLDDDTGKEYMGATDGFRKWLEGGMIAPHPDFVTGEEVEYFKKLILAPTRGI
ncbi:hypothetical protein EYC84_011632 [Monilinia fructicola]|uniref:AB hydrolase-1 domain-containing protein n=1 Tax=Monilinia fructicola TaxID=38448 RepID=A0A5M9J6K4_MONFR|nr:hypothetical protein EYC84_011632 [Monilinia fructicola]